MEYLASLNESEELKRLGLTVQFVRPSSSKHSVIRFNFEDVSHLSGKTFSLPPDGSCCMGVECPNLHIADPAEDHSTSTTTPHGSDPARQVRGSHS